MLMAVLDRSQEGWTGEKTSPTTEQRTVQVPLNMAYDTRFA